MAQRLNALLLTALLLPASTPSTTGQDRHATPPQEVFASALEKGSEREQLAAISLLTNFPSLVLAPTLATLALNERATLQVRRSALKALGQTDAALNSRTCALLLKNARTAPVLRQDAALGHAGQLGSKVEGVYAEQLRDVLSDWSEPDDLRLCCAMSLLSCPEPKASVGFCSLLEDLLWAAPHPCHLHQQIATCLPLLTDEKHRNRLHPLLESPLPRVRMLTAEAWLRLGGERTEELVARTREGLPQRERDSGALNVTAWRKIRAAGWAPSTKKQLMAAVGKARVVCVGELHSPSGSYLRRFQIEVLEAMANGEAPLAVGYEPPVQHAQQSVLDRANELEGVSSFAAEQGTEELCQLKAYAARDANCAAVLGERLRERNNERILLLRGQGHLAPGNTLLSALPEDCLVIYTVPLGLPLELALEQRCAPGFVARSRLHTRLFFVNVREPIAHLAAEEAALLERACRTKAR